jgi:hypothetical protein
VRYAALPDEPTLEARPDLIIGSVGGEGPDVFGDIRSVDAASDGTIYVLDAQAVEIRVFDGQGRPLRTLGGRGEGPGEITAANGIQLVGDSLIWVQDYGKGSMVALTSDGAERERRPMPLRSFAYVWRGTVDAAGRYWEPTVESDAWSGGPMEPGVHQPLADHYLVRTDPTWTSPDSLVLGQARMTILVVQFSGGSLGNFGVPFEPQPMSAVGLDGDFWETQGTAYILARRDASGDTLVRIEAPVPSTPVSDADAARYREPYENDPERLRAAERVVEVMPDTKPPIAALTTDDQGRLWVERARAPEARPLYHVFSNEGRFLAVVELAFEPAEHLPLRIRHGHLYAVSRDSVNVPYVVRAPVPLTAADPKR